MKRIFALLLFIPLCLAVSCAEETNNDQDNSGLNLSNVISGSWSLTNVKQIDDGSIQGFPYYRDYTTDTIFEPSTAVFGDIDTDVDIRYGYKARDYNSSPPTPYTTGGFIDMEGTYEVTGDLLRIFTSSDTLSMIATTAEQNTLVFRRTEVINEPGIEQYATITETFTWSRVQ